MGGFGLENWKQKLSARPGEEKGPHDVEGGTVTDSHPEGLIRPIDDLGPHGLPLLTEGLVKR